MKLKKTLLKIGKMILYTFIIFIVSITLFVNFAPTFGGVSKGDSKSKIEQSNNFKDGKFQNLEPMKLVTNSSEHNKSVRKVLLGDKSSKNPQEPISTIRFNKTQFHENKDSITWFGHSTILLKTSNVTIITDPVFHRASPLSFLGPKPFDMTNIPRIDDLPEKIDIVLITHDHYDHLDYKTIKKIHTKVERFFVPLGVKSHLIKWGVPQEKIEEIEWYENTSYKNTDFTLTPTRHFSGRSLGNRDSTLWGGWIIKSETQNIYISGDGGYSSEFKKIGDKYGPFDIAFVENGAYNIGWKNTHMFPEESVAAAIDVNAKVAMPIHWGKFDLSTHHWLDPINRFTKEAQNKNLTIATPQIGQTFTLNPLIPQTRWWED